MGKTLDKIANICLFVSSTVLIVYGFIGLFGVIDYMPIEITFFLSLGFSGIYLLYCSIRGKIFQHKT